mmetsp:Transcript_29286/g.73099  ORF Transcript_29286/g.73099 Transcript_29286/m.73099 type:complete len:217 (+) Transcript_29286:2286-2936(+)
MSPCCLLHPCSTAFTSARPSFARCPLLTLVQAHRCPRDFLPHWRHSCRLLQRGCTRALWMSLSCLVMSSWSVRTRHPTLVSITSTARTWPTTSLSRQCYKSARRCSAVRRTLACAWRASSCTEAAVRQKRRRSHETRPACRLRHSLRSWVCALSPPRSLLAACSAWSGQALTPTNRSICLPVAFCSILHRGSHKFFATVRARTPHNGVRSEVAHSR